MLPLQMTIFLIFQLTLLSLSVRPALAEDIRDVKPPLPWPGFPWFMMAAITLIILFAAVLFWYWQRRRSHLKETTSAQPSPWECALNSLQLLLEKNLPGQGKVKEYFTELSDIIRHYMEDRFAVNAPEMTTEEFLVSLKEKDFLTAPQKTALRNFLTCCDMVKFAQYGSNLKEMEQSFHLGKKLIEETRETTFPGS